MKKLTVLLLLLVFASAGFGQKGFSKGFVVLLTGDTLRGFIKEKSLYDYAPAVVMFEEKANAEKQLLSEQVKQIGLEKEQGMYEPWNVTLDISYIDPQNLVVENEDSTVARQILLQKIYAGTKLNLYFYRSKAKEFYFVYANGKMEELIIKYKTYVSKQMPSYENLYRTPRYTILPYYRDQLLKYFDWQSQKKLALKVKELEYEKSKILDIVRQIDKS